MDEMADVFVYGLQSSLNPFVAAGTILAGLFLQRWSLVVLVCVAWVGLITALQITMDTPLTRAPEYVIISRATVGIPLGTILFLIASLLRRLWNRDA